MLKKLSLYAACNLQLLLAKWPCDKKEEFRAQIIEHLNDIFLTHNLTDKHRLNYAYTLHDKLTKNEIVMKRLGNHTRE